VIRWCRGGDPEQWAHRWRREWLGASLAPSRSVIAAQLSVPDARDSRDPGNCASDTPFAGTPVPPPGGRLVLIVRLAEDCLDGPSWLLAWAARQLVPEIAHDCDPVPGEPRFGRSWLRAAGVLSERGRYTAGCVLARRFTPADLADRTIRVVTGVGPLPGYFPLPTGAPVPSPLAPGLWGVAEVAAAFGVSVPDAVPLVDELFWAGVLIVDGAPP
jgi:hypothetical protein